MWRLPQRTLPRGRSFQKLGVEKPWPAADPDAGRMAVTGQAADRSVFKVPSLRNVAETRPYFHNGNVATLQEAVRLMGDHQLGTQLQDRQVRQIVAWLGTLTGELPREWIQTPKLPG